MRKSKVGLHLLAGHDDWQHVDPMLRNHRPRGMLLLEDFAEHFIERVTAFTDFPAIRVIWPRERVDGGYRRTHDPNRWMEYLFENRPWIIEAGERAAAQGKSIGLCGHNEPHSEDLDLMKSYAHFEAERAGMLSPYPGLHAIVGNFGVGRTSRELLDIMLNQLTPAFRKGWASLGLHQYWYLLPHALMKWPGWNFLAGSQGGQSLFANPLPPVPKRSELQEAWLFGRNLVDIPDWVPVVLTEFGWDQVYQAEEWFGRALTRDGEPYTGVVNSRYRLNREYDIQSGSALGFFLAYDVLGWADRLLQQFPNVRCAYFFGLGPHYDDEFGDYDIAQTEAYWPLAAYIEEQGDTADRVWRSIRYWYTLYWQLTGQV